MFPFSALPLPLRAGSCCPRPAGKHGQEFPFLRRGKRLAQRPLGLRAGVSGPAPSETPVFLLESTAPAGRPLSQRRACGAGPGLPRPTPSPGRLPAAASRATCWAGERSVGRDGGSGAVRGDKRRGTGPRSRFPGRGDRALPHLLPPGPVPAPLPPPGSASATRPRPLPPESPCRPRWRPQ